MRPRVALLFALLAGGLAACTPMQWVKPDASAEQIRMDEQACRQAAWREAQFQSFLYQHQFQPMVVAPGQVIWPSGAMVDPYGHQLLYENRLADFCMESKGYQLVPVPKP
ncbi:MAG TPA: hypothetical protein VFZ54_00215 [Burkholderiales bacterium]